MINETFDTLVEYYGYIAVRKRACVNWLKLFLMKLKIDIERDTVAIYANTDLVWCDVYDLDDLKNRDKNDLYRSIRSILPIMRYSDIKAILCEKSNNLFMSKDLYARYKKNNNLRNKFQEASYYEAIDIMQQFNNQIRYDNCIFFIAQFDRGDINIFYDEIAII